MKSRETNYYKIGSFVILGIAILIVATLFFASGKVFQKTIYAETYFNETVQGLSVGSAVKYRGLQIGHVKNIKFVNQVYNGNGFSKKSNYSRLIYVRLAITSSLLTKTPQKELERSFKRDVAEGLRIKLALQGLTGNAYIELDYVNPKTNPPLAIHWTPLDFYIPSTPSTLTAVGENVSVILEKLKQADLQRLFFNVEQLTSATNRTMNKVSNLIEKNQQQVSAIANNLRDVSEQAQDYPSSVLFGKAPPRLNPRSL